MANFHTTLTSLFSDIADAIRRKTGGTSDLVADDFPLEIDAIPTGTPLPSLTNPASASDVLDGKEVILPDANDQPVKVTGTLVPPTDTGANGLYKAIIEDTATELIDEDGTLFPDHLYSYQFANRTSLNKISLPHVTSIGEYAFYQCANLTGIINIPNAVVAIKAFDRAFRGTVVLSVDQWNQTFGNIQHDTTLSHLWVKTLSWDNSNYSFRFNPNVHSVQYDTTTSFNFAYSGSDNANFNTFIIRTPTLTTALSSSTLAHGTDFYIYVPSALLNDYKTATNWTALAQYFVSIDEDTTATVGTQFTPTTSATVDHWDQVDLQSYSVGTVDTTTGAITPTHDGRLLIRGLDANDEIVHVTYLQIGTGFDEEANLA